MNEDQVDVLMKFVYKGLATGGNNKREKKSLFVIGFD
jgi:hypothetical protein